MQKIYNLLNDKKLYTKFEVMQNVISFCQELRSELFDQSSDIQLALTLALAGNKNAQSPTELSLNPVYNYHYSNISKATHALCPDEQERELVTVKNKTVTYHTTADVEKQFRHIVFQPKYSPPLYNSKFHLLNIDTTSIIRQYSPYLTDKTYVYSVQNGVAGNKPVNIGYTVSTIGIVDDDQNTNWNPPISMQRIPSDQNTAKFSAGQLKVILQDKELPLFEQLTITTSDSHYCNSFFVGDLYQIENLINIVRIAANRNVYKPYQGEQNDGAGPKKRYGQKYNLSNLANILTADHIEKSYFKTSRGRECVVLLKQFNNFIITGKNDMPMWDKPFNLIKVEIYDKNTGELVFKRPMWITVWGKSADLLTTTECYECFRKRFDIEHFFRFGKQKLLLNSFQSVDTQHVENWLIDVMIAYWLLYVSRYDGQNIVRPWEQYAPKNENTNKDKNTDKENEEKVESSAKSPSRTQRALNSIISGFVKKELVPKPRNNSNGRKMGETQTKKERSKTIKKRKNGK